MSYYLTTDTDLTSVANAIRTKANINTQLEFPTDFVTAIGNISAGAATPYQALGEGWELVEHITDYNVALSSTDFATWSPSTTATNIKATANESVSASINLGSYDYCIKTTFVFLPDYGSSTPSNRIVKGVNIVLNYIIVRHNSITAINSGTVGGATQATYQLPLMEYKGSNESSQLSFGTGYGIFLVPNQATLSSNTSLTPTITYKTPTIRAQVNNTVMSSTAMSALNQSSSKIIVSADLYKCTNTMYQKLYDDVITLYLTPVT